MQDPATIFPGCPRNHSPKHSPHQEICWGVLCSLEKTRRSPSVLPQARFSPCPCTANWNPTQRTPGCTLTALSPAERSGIKWNVQPESLSQHSASPCFQRHWGKENKATRDQGKVRERARIFPQVGPLRGLTVVSGNPRPADTNPFNQARTSSSAVFPPEQTAKY